LAAQAWHPELDDDDLRRPGRRRPRRSAAVAFLWVLVLLLLVVGVGAGLALYSGAIEVEIPLLEGRGETDPPAAPPGQQAPAPGEQASNAPPQPQMTVTARETYGDWVYTCVELPAGDETRCGIVQQLLNKETGAGVFVWRIAQDGKGGLVSEWQTPTGIVVGRGIVLDAGTEEPITIPFQACTPTGCVAVANLAADFVETLSRTESASAVVFPIGGQGVRLILSVKGLAESLVALGHTPGVVEPMGASEPAAADGGE
jgi:invasion protein IalB